MSPAPNNTRAGLLLILLAAVFTYVLIHLFSVRFATGEVYPEYSSLRSDHDGAKLLYDSLSRTPGVIVSRSYQPLDFVEDNAATIFLLAVDPQEFGRSAEPYLKAIERVAGRGNRVVAAMRWSKYTHPERAEELQRQWHVRFDVDPDVKHAHHLYFSEAAGWRVLDRAGAQILAIEKPFGKGSVELVSESDDFGNAATAALDRLATVSTAIGPNSRVVFDEEHFGIAASGSVVGLARRFRLTGMAIGLAICAALFIWKNASGFPPPSLAPMAERLSGRTSASGLLTLLRRHIPPGELAAVCWREWLAGNRGEVPPEGVRRAEAALHQQPGRPLETVREIQTVLHAKGPL